MRSIVLFKQHRCTQLAHLYEHLYMRQVNDFFYSKGLFKNLDYAAYGTTFAKGGIITVEIDLYTEDALRLEQQLSSMRIQLDDGGEAAGVELARIFAEEQYQPHITDKDEVLRQLALLDTRPWTPIDKLPPIDTRNARAQRTPIHLTKIKQARPIVLSIAITLDKTYASKNRTYAPLFSTLARIYTLTLHYKLGAAYGFYDKASNTPARSHTMPSKLVLYKDLVDIVQFEHITTLAQEVASYTFSCNTLRRAVDSIHAMDYRSDIAGTLGFEDIFERTGIMMGLAGWREITSEATIRDILEHASITLSYQKQTAKLPLRSPQ